MKGLFEFADGTPVEASEPTCVVAEEIKSPVCLTSEEGFGNYCQDCQKLLIVQETGFRVFSIRVFCAVGKCVK